MLTIFKKVLLFVLILCFWSPRLCFAEGALALLDGTQIPLASLKGKWVFINYWASWCGPCVDEIAEFNRFYATHSKKRVALFAVNYDEVSVHEQYDLARQFDIHYPSLNPSSLRILHLKSIEVVPITYVYNPQGHLATILYGGQKRQSLQALMGE